MKNIAIFGGSFDPPTIGHVMVISHILLNEKCIDEVLVIPCYLQAGKTLTDFEYRYQMCQMAFGWLPRVSISRAEQNLGGESLTARTVKVLYDSEPNCQFRFVMGSDLLDKVEFWDGWNVVKELAPPLVIGRAGISGGGGHTPICPQVSSTIVREALKQGKYWEAGRYLPAQVTEHIITHQLYLEDIDE